MDMVGGKEGRGLMLVKAVALVLALILSLLFAYFNMSKVKISFFKYSYELPLFALVLGSFGSGLLIAFLVQSLKGVEWKRYGERLKRSMRNIGLGYVVKGRAELEKLLDNEEVLPLYFQVSKELGEEPSLYLQRYSLGIVETMKALDLFKTDRSRAIDLLEKALGKNWENLRARAVLRSLYYLEGEIEKALDLQRKLVEDVEKPLKKREKAVLADILSELKGESAVEELEKLPLTPTTLTSFLSVGIREDKYVRLMFEEDLHNEALMVMLTKNVLTPRVVQEVENRKEKVNQLVLAHMYVSVGMYERLESLKDTLPTPIRMVIERGYGKDGDCYRELLASLTLFECDVCGKEYSDYVPVCRNCLSWHRLKIKGGSEDVN